MSERDYADEIAESLNRLRRHRRAGGRPRQGEPEALDVRDRFEGGADRPGRGEHDTHRRSFGRGEHGEHDRRGWHDRGGQWSASWSGSSDSGRGGRGARMGGPASARLLMVLARADRPLSVSEIAEAVGVDQPRASRLVAQGVEHGLVRREADPDDARRTSIALTEQGLAAARHFRGAQRDQVAIALESFSDDEREQLASLLARLAGSWPL